MSNTRWGTSWLLASLAELALIDIVDGHVRRSMKYLREFDDLLDTTDANPPGTTWAGAEVARALGAQEHGDAALLDRATARLSLVGGDLEAWPLLLIAESAFVRRARGPTLALTLVTSGLKAHEAPHPARNPWIESLVFFEAALNSAVGNLRRAAQLLTGLPASSAPLRVERARLELFASHDINALVLAQAVGELHPTKRERVEATVIAAVAAWSCGHEDEAIASIAAAAKLIHKFALSSALIGVPFEQLRDLASAAKDAQVCDVVASVDAIPVLGRSHRYEQLTGMELRTLTTIRDLQNANQAAEALFVTPATIKKHLASVYKKLRVKGRDAAILRASRMGLLDPPRIEEP